MAFGIGNPFPFPNPLGNGAPDPMGGLDLLTKSVSNDIVAVRLVNTNPIDVRVMNFPGVPPPLPGIKPGAVPPPLPSSGPPKRKVDSLGLDDVGLGKLAKLGTLAGAAGAVVGSIVDFKSTFIDPLLGAARGGFNQGFARGAGTEVLGKSFEAVGTAIGVTLLPTVIKVSAAALGMATMLDKASDGLERLYNALPDLPGGGKNGDGLIASGFGLGDKLEKINPNAWLGKLSGSLGGFDFSPSGIRKKVFGADDKKVFADANKAEREALPLVLQSLRNSIGGQATRMGVADVREQAQQAALQQDPIEAKLKQMLLEKLEKYELGLNAIATNTEPKG